MPVPVVLPAGQNFNAECARCGFHYLARQTDVPRSGSTAIAIIPWPPCPKCGHLHVYAVREAVA
jgi:ribosomal protein S27AE